MSKMRNHNAKLATAQADSAGVAGRIATLQRNGVPVRSAASAAQKPKYIDFVNPHKRLPCISLEWLVGARGFQSGRILQIRAQQGKYAEAFMLLQYGMGGLLARAHVMHVGTGGALPDAGRVADSGCAPEDLMIIESRSLDEVFAHVDKAVRGIRGHRPGESVGPMLKNPVDPDMQSPVIVGICSPDAIADGNFAMPEASDAGPEPARELDRLLGSRVLWLRETQTFMMLATSLQAPVLSHADYVISLSSAPRRNGGRGALLCDVVKAGYVENGLKPKRRQLSLCLVSGHGFDLVKTDWEFLSRHPESPFPATGKNQLYRDSRGITCKALGSKPFKSEEDFLRAFYCNIDMHMTMREKMKIRGLGFAFENKHDHPCSV